MALLLTTQYTCLQMRQMTLLISQQLKSKQQMLQQNQQCHQNSTIITNTCALSYKQEKWLLYVSIRDITFLPPTANWVSNASDLLKWLRRLDDSHINLTSYDTSKCTQSFQLRTSSPLLQVKTHSKDHFQNNQTWYMSTAMMNLISHMKSNKSSRNT